MGPRVGRRERLVAAFGEHRGENRDRRERARCEREAAPVRERDCHPREREEGTGKGAREAARAREQDRREDVLALEREQRGERDRQSEHIRNATREQLGSEADREPHRGEHGGATREERLGDRGEERRGDHGAQRDQHARSEERAERGREHRVCRRDRARRTKRCPTGRSPRARTSARGRWRRPDLPRAARR